MDAPSVSVVIPAYRAEGTIARAIDSVLAQTAPAGEIIVIDDGSPDHQVDVVNRYGDAVKLIRGPNRKTAIARNIGIERASGDYIAFLDADDYWEPHKLERQLQILDQYPQVAVVGSANYLCEPGGDRLDVAIPARSWRDRVLRVRGGRAFRLATIMWTGTLVVRREVLGSERFVPGLEPAEDRDLWMRLVQRGGVYLISQPLATAVLEPGSISRSDIDRDCGKMLEVVHRHRAALGLLGTMFWRSHTYYRWAAINRSPRPALRQLAQSFCYWPLPYTGLVGMQTMGRLKRLVVLLGMLLQRQPDVGNSYRE